MSNKSHTYGERNDLLPLHLNENLFLPQTYYKRIKADMEYDIARYPSPTAKDLKVSLAEYYGLQPDQFVIGNGSDALLDTLFKMVAMKGGSMANYVPSYGLVRFFAKRNGVRLVEVPFKGDFSVPSSTDFIEDVEAVMLCSPNNPTSVPVNKGHLAKLLECDRLVMVDEAYVEYADHNCLDMVNEYSNLILVRTFSKAWGLAGARVGYTVSSPENAERMEDVKIPFSVNSLSLSVAKGALYYSSIMKESVQKTIEERERMLRKLRTFGFNCLPSQTNFIFCRTPSEISPDKLHQYLVEEGISIRIFEEDNVDEYVRITVGRPDMNACLLEALGNIL